MSEIRHALRRLLQRPGPTIACVFALALAIGAVATTAGIVGRILVAPLPVNEPDRLVTFHRGSDFGSTDEFMYEDFLRIRESHETFTGIAGMAMQRVAITLHGTTRGVQALFVTPNYFQLLGVALPLGRNFTAAENRPGAPVVVILSDRFWRDALERRADAIGTESRVTGVSATIVGVAPRGFSGTRLALSPDLFIPVRQIARLGAPNNYFSPVTVTATNGATYGPQPWIDLIGRLARAASFDAARAHADALLRADEPQDRTQRLELIPAERSAIPGRPELINFIGLFTGALLLLLLTGCVTLGMLTLIRTEERRQELAIRLALGASRAQLTRGVLTESVMLSGVAAALAPLVAMTLFGLLQRYGLPAGLGDGVDFEALELGVDSEILMAAAATAILAAGFIAAIGSRFVLSRAVGDALKATGSTRRAVAGGARRLLVVTQVAVAIVLVVGTGLFVQSLRAAFVIDLGYDATSLSRGSLNLARYNYDDTRGQQFFEELLQRLSRDARVSHAAAIASGRGTLMPVVDGIERRLSSAVPFQQVTASFFGTMRIPLHQGRYLSDDDTEWAPKVAVVSESTARALWPGTNPLGRLIQLPWRSSTDPDFPQVQVVGVVGDVIQDVRLNRPPFAVYLPQEQYGGETRGTIFVRARRNSSAATEALVTSVRAMNREVTVESPQSMDDVLAEQLGPQRFGTAVFSVLGLIAFVLAALGMYVLVAAAAATRMRELGIRSALGASRTRLLRLMLAETGAMVGVGVAAGLLAAWVARGFVEAFLFRTEAGDPVTYIGSASLLLTVALLVVLRPALHAACVDPGRVLRYE